MTAKVKETVPPPQRAYRMVIPGMVQFASVLYYGFLPRDRTRPSRNCDGLQRQQHLQPGRAAALGKTRQQQLTILISCKMYLSKLPKYFSKSKMYLSKLYWVGAADLARGALGKTQKQQLLDAGRHFSFKRLPTDLLFRPRLHGFLTHF